MAKKLNPLLIRRPLENVTVQTHMRGGRAELNCLTIDGKQIPSWKDEGEADVTLEFVSGHCLTLYIWERIGDTAGKNISTRLNRSEVEALVAHLSDHLARTTA